MSNSESLDKLRALRGGQQSVISRFINEAAALMEEEISAKGLSRLKTLSGYLADKVSILEQLDDKIVNAIPVEEIKNGIVCAAKLSDKIGETGKDIAEFRDKATSGSSVVVSPPYSPEGDKTVSSPHDQSETDGPQHRSDSVNTTPTRGGCRIF